MQQEVLANNKALEVKVEDLVTSNKKLLEQHEVMGLELNQQQKEIEELKTKVSNLDTLDEIYFTTTNELPDPLEKSFRY